MNTTNFKNGLIHGLVLGTQSAGKIQELKALFQDFGVKVQSLVDVFEENPQLSQDEPEETGTTFLDNALIKGKYYANLTGLPVLADDSGLCIDALDQKPGVHTKPFFEAYGSYEKAFADLEEILCNEKNDNNPDNDSSNMYSATMHCVLCLVFPDGTYKDYHGICEGHVVFPARYQKPNESSQSDEPQKPKSFGVDPIFQPLHHTKTFAEDVAHKNQVSHRVKALSLMVADLFKSQSKNSI